MLGKLESKLVVTIHGIRTRGAWQKELTPHLARHGLIPYHIDYGFFGFLGFVFAPTRERLISRIRNELGNLIAESGVERVSIIAHSFGTFIAMECLRREKGGIQYDRVVLTGSILSTDLDWSHLEREKWILAVRNERATGDFAVSLARLLSSRMFRWLSQLDGGDSGRVAFKRPASLVIDSEVEGGHSQVHNALKYQTWARFIAYPRLPEKTRKRFCTELQRLRQDAANYLGQDVKEIRVNFFAPLGGALKMIPELTENMNWVPEYDIEIQPKDGATGQVFQTGDAHIVVRRDNDQWSGNTLPTGELAKVHPDLCWIISMPVICGSRGVVGVINIDGLNRIPPVMRDTESEDCRALVISLWQSFETTIPEFLMTAYDGNLIRSTEK